MYDLYVNKRICRDLEFKEYLALIERLIKCYQVVFNENHQCGRGACTASSHNRAMAAVTTIIRMIHEDGKHDSV